MWNGFEIGDVIMVGDDKIGVEALTIVEKPDERNLWILDFMSRLGLEPDVVYIDDGKAFIGGVELASV